jgi:endogenous inhibitor of DNA gyrase (YacG/DUF329 family)
MKTCTKDNCDRAHRARGLCASHYNQEHAPNRHAKKLTACAFCGTEVMKNSGTSKARRPVCSDQCRQWLTTPYCALPADHWARWHGRSSAWKPKALAKPVPKISKDCEWCGAGYETHQSVSKFCTVRCSIKAAKLRRRAREHGAPGMYSWAQVMRLFMAGNKMCAYCDKQIDGQPDPDHVVPLSRGGRNDMGNIVPCCHSCNADKCDLTLDEWAIERMRLGKRPLRYVLAFSDPRFKHLTLDQATGVAWRHLNAA